MGARGAMSTQRAHFEPFAWWLARERIGQDLRERYPALQEVPSRLLALVEKLDASQSNQSTQEMPSDWLSKLDAIEGDQLLRACKKRMTARTRSHCHPLSYLLRTFLARLRQPLL